MKLRLGRKLERIKEIIYLIKKIKQYAKIHKKCYWLIGTPIHGNIGDHAIAVAERKFFEDNGIKIFEIPDYYKFNNFILFCLLKYAKKDDVIFIHGGGFMGTEYFHAEIMIRNIIQKFPNNKIIIMPQTIFYKNDDFSKVELENSKKVYNKHKNLYICAREKKSYDMMKTIYPNAKVLEVPDIVLYLNESKKENRSGILFAIRADVEKKISGDEMKYIIDIAKKLDNNVIITDTVQKDGIPIENREKFLQKKLDEFRKAKLVITDRLHGMIFAAITETPCIVFSNYNHKIKGVYAYIKELNYISYLEDSRDVKREIQKLLELKNIKLDNANLKKEYNKIFKCIEE